MTADVTFQEYIGQDDTLVRPAVGALLFARHEYPGLDVSVYLGRLDAYGRSAARRLAGLRDPFQIVHALNRLFFVEEGLPGDPFHERDPRCGYVHEVLDRRPGDPLALSAIYLDVARSCGLPFRGISFPGRILVRYDHPDSPLYIDPFDAGMILTHEALRARLVWQTGLDAEPLDAHLRAIGQKAILIRMLNQLKRLYRKADAPAKIYWVSDCLLALDPRSAEHLRDRGLAAFRLQRYPEALRDLSRVVAAAPPGPGQPDLLETLRDLHRQVSLMN